MLVHNPALSGCLNIVNKNNHVSLLFADIPNTILAVEEHLALVGLLNKNGIKTIELYDLICEEDKLLLQTNPNIIFTRDPIITIPWLPKVGILGQMSKTARVNEVKIVAKIASMLGLEQIVYLDSGLTCEGGDVIPLRLKNKRVLFVRTGGRTSSQILDVLVKHPMDICDEIVEIHCKKEILHLDSVIGIAGKNTVVYEPGAITAAYLHTKDFKNSINLSAYLKDQELQILTVTADEADRLQATNFINIDDHTILAYSSCERILNQLQRRDINTLTFNGNELSKGRGGPRCLTRPIYT